MAREEDINFISGILCGDKKSENKLYNKYKKIIFKYIVNKYPFNRNTDDDVSEILIKVFEKLESFNKDRSKFSTWVISIINNHMIDKSRSTAFYMANNTTAYNSDATGTITITNSFGNNGDVTLDNLNLNNAASFTAYDKPETTFENKDSVSFIQSTVGTEDFYLLNMKYVEGYNYSELGKEMNTSSTTISNRVNYVKGKLKKKQ